MLKTISTIIMFLAITVTTATSGEITHEVCKELSFLSGTIMESRQEGVPMYDLMEIANQNPQLPIVKELVILAFEQPRYSVKSNQQDAVSEFQNEVYLECIK